MRAARAGRLLTGVAAIAVAVAPAGPPAGAAVVPAGAGPVGYVAELAPGQRPASLPAAASLRVLQLNLCNSGYAGCYAGGRSVPEAAAVIRTRRPDAVTLNEVCRGDAERTLFRAMARAWPGDWVFGAFEPAWDRDRNAPLRCANGDQYGVAVLGHVPPAGWAGVVARGGHYPVQDPGSAEQRAWLCADAAGAYRVCTTHLAANAARVALDQCRYLMTAAVPPAGAAGEPRRPTVVAGDLNLAAGAGPDVRSCVPAGWSRAGDGALQHVLAAGRGELSSATIGLRYTDHDALLVTVRTR